jgi:hypothetical protein
MIVTKNALLKMIRLKILLKMLKYVYARGGFHVKERTKIKQLLSIKIEASRSIPL